mgnify:CR=1 FL=1
MSRLAPTIALALAGAVTLSACSTAEPGRTPDADHTRPVTVTVTGNSAEQIILGEIFFQTLQKAGREVALDSDPSSEGPHRLKNLRSGSSDLVIGCTGLFLFELDPQRAEELSAEIEAGDVEDPADTTYREFIGALPGGITAPDPSSAQGCQGSVEMADMPELPQGIVPAYNRNLFDRDERKAITDVTRFLTTEEIAALIEKARATSSASQAVQEWLPI